MKTFKIAELKKIMYVICGSVMFGFSVNVFLIPASIYNGGLTGISQLLRDAIVSFFDLNLSFDLLGIIVLCMNIPIFIFAWKRLSPKFVKLSFLSIISQTVALTFIPIPSAPVVDDVFIAIALAAVIGAFGCSLTYRAKGSSGGMDLIAFYYSQKNKGSLGRFYLIVNGIIYSICMVIYNVQIALYSLVYSFIYSYFLDIFHKHNIEVSVMVFTKNPEIKKFVMEEIHRGVTHWQGYGAYTGSELDIFVTIVAQPEISDLKRLIRKHDPQAFIVVTQKLHVDGGFEKRLI